MKALDGDHYLGPRGLQFHIWPGSGLKKNRPRWLMAGELQETTRVFARNVARIEPDWIEKAAAHLVDRAWVEPHWDKARGEVVAYENVNLFGLVLAARRKVSFGKLDPVRAREVFIEGALVAGEFESPHPFWSHNRKLIREVEDLEHRTRRPDVLVDDRAIYEFYARSIPDDVRDARSFDAWYRDAAKGQPKLLFLAQVRPHAPRRRVGDRGALPAHARGRRRHACRSPIVSSPATRSTASPPTFRWRCSTRSTKRRSTGSFRE